MEQSDMLYGHASEGQVKRIQAAMKRIQAVSDWDQQLKLLGVRPEGNPDTGVFITKLLRRAWQNSLKKGYHKKVISPPHLVLSFHIRPKLPLFSTFLFSIQVSQGMSTLDTWL